MTEQQETIRKYIDLTVIDFGGVIKLVIVSSIGVSSICVKNPRDRKKSTKCGAGGGGALFQSE